ncbi:hypothetical protein NDU88_006102 [Pleurodeles waltl]|uniref:Uncharacterized protein n=1 Tax=Pleurodeles waltl TaxID=8319 RepID=A0AAV7NP96_PLEWA|nr:hypothetical protein NDU88_006102 [Pleurodeles waltl]
MPGMGHCHREAIAGPKEMCAIPDSAAVMRVTVETTERPKGTPEELLAVRGMINNFQATDVAKRAAGAPGFTEGVERRATDADWTGAMTGPPETATGKEEE